MHGGNGPYYSLLRFQYELREGKRRKMEEERREREERERIEREERERQEQLERIRRQEEEELRRREEEEARKRREEREKAEEVVVAAEAAGVSEPTDFFLHPPASCSVFVFCLTFIFQCFFF